MVQYTIATDKVILQLATPQAASNQRTHVLRTQGRGRTHPVNRRVTTQYLHTQHAWVSLKIQPICTDVIECLEHVQNNHWGYRACNAQTDCSVPRIHKHAASVKLAVVTGLVRSGLDTCVQVSFTWQCSCYWCRGGC